MANILETVSFQPHIFAQEMHAVPAVLAGKIGHLLKCVHVWLVWLVVVVVGKTFLQGET